MPPNRNSILCPKCRMLISRDENSCPHCGLRNPGSPWKTITLGKGLLGPDRIMANIITVNVGMFIMSILLNPARIGFSGNPLGFLSPDPRVLRVLGDTGTVPIFYDRHWWTLLSANYLHGSLLHILFNMIALWQIGPFVVREYGPYRTFSIYTLSGISGFLVSSFAGVPFTLGASAAICGLIGAALYFGKSRGGQYGQSVYRQVGGWAIGIFVFGFMVPGINNWGHGGGLLAGIVIAFFLGYQERGRETYYHKMIGIMCVLTTLGVLLLSVGRFWAVLLMGH